MSRIEVVLVGPRWRPREKLQDNVVVSLSTDEPLSSSVGLLRARLGLQETTTVRLYRALGSLPNVSVGKEVPLSSSPRESGLRAMTILYVIPSKGLTADPAAAELLNDKQSFDVCSRWRLTAKTPEDEATVLVLDKDDIPTLVPREDVQRLRELWGSLTPERSSASDKETARVLVSYAGREDELFDWLERQAKAKAKAPASKTTGKAKTTSPVKKNGTAEVEAEEATVFPWFPCIDPEGRAPRAREVQELLKDRAVLRRVGFTRDRAVWRAWGPSVRGPTAYNASMYADSTRLLTCTGRAVPAVQGCVAGACALMLLLIEDIELRREREAFVPPPPRQFSAPLPDPAITRAHAAVSRRRRVLREILESQSSTLLCESMRVELARLTRPSAEEIANGDIITTLAVMQEMIQALLRHPTLRFRLPPHAVTSLEGFISAPFQRKDGLPRPPSPTSVEFAEPVASSPKWGTRGRRNSDVDLIDTPASPRRRTTNLRTLPLDLTPEFESSVRFALDAFYSLHHPLGMTKVGLLVSHIVHGDPEGVEERRDDVMRNVCDKYEVDQAEWVGSFPRGPVHYLLHCMYDYFDTPGLPVVPDLADRIVEDPDGPHLLRSTIEALCDRWRDRGAVAADWTGAYPLALRLAHHPLVPDDESHPVAPPTVPAPSHPRTLPPPPPFPTLADPPAILDIPSSSPLTPAPGLSQLALLKTPLDASLEGSGQPP